MDNVIMNLPV